jgi:methylmalonyl-CoA mutase cobalamin-binding domain/chain
MKNAQLVDALASLNEEEVGRLVRNRIDSGVDAMSIVSELREGMDIVGERFKKGEYFLSELIVSGEIFKESMKLIEPLLKTGKGDRGTKLVLGTVKGDIHSIGKDIVAVLLRASGFEVYDLGINVPPSAFVNKLIETKAPILGMSGLLTPSFESMKETVEAVEAAGLRDKVKVIVGGGVVTELVKRHAGADAFTTDAIEGVEICKQFARGAK